MYQRILVATDGTEQSNKAVDAAIELALRFQAQLVALKVVPHYPQTYFEGGMALPVTDMEQVEQQWADQAQKEVDSAAAKAIAQGLVARGVVARSDVVSDAILSVTQTENCDLIVMASHGRKGIQRLLLGSETQHVLTHATVPVLVLK